jgi:hypothetical protein
MIHPRHHIRSVLAVTLALAAGAATTAAADYLPHQSVGSESQGNRSVCSEACSYGGYTYGYTPPHMRGEQAPGVGHGVQIPGLGRGGLAAGRGRSHQTTSAATARSADGFDWGDAAIGAGGAIVIMSLAAGGARASVTRRRRQAGEVA